MMDGDEGFHLEEYKQIRAEVIGQLARIEQLFRYAIVVSASVTAWLLTSTLGVTSPNVICVKVPRNFAAFGWLIAPAFVLTTGLMAAVLMYSVTHMARYLRRLEQVLGRRNLGWEQFNAGKNWVITTATGAVWLMLFSVCLGAACIAYPIANNAAALCVH